MFIPVSGIWGRRTLPVSRAPFKSEIGGTNALQHRQRHAIGRQLDIVDLNTYYDQFPSPESTVGSSHGLVDSAIGCQERSGRMRGGRIGRDRVNRPAGAGYQPLKNAVHAAYLGYVERSSRYPCKIEWKFSPSHR